MKMVITLLVFCLMSSPLFAEKITIGTSPFDPPMEMQATAAGVFTGFEIDLVNEVCRRIGASCVYKPMTFKEIMIDVYNGKLDLGIDGFFITNERLVDYLFSLPYLQTKAQLIALADSKISVSNVNTGLRIGVEEGTVFKSLLLKKYDNIEVIEFKTQPIMLQDLSDHKIDLIMFDYIGSSYWVNNSGGAFKLVGEPTAMGMGYGILANRTKGPLIARVNKALNDMENDGTYLSIYSRYF
jgi:arginine transport system substrate-binding protein